MRPSSQRCGARAVDYASERGAKRRESALDLRLRHSQCSFGKILYKRQRAMAINMVLGVRRWTMRATSCRLKGERTPGAAKLFDDSVIATGAKTTLSDADSILEGEILFGGPRKCLPERCMLAGFDQRCHRQLRWMQATSGKEQHGSTDAHVIAVIAHAAQKKAGVWKRNAVMICFIVTLPLKNGIILTHRCQQPLGSGCCN
jgi:hypothetical protein